MKIKTSRPITIVAAYAVLVLVCVVSFLLPRTFTLSTVSATSTPDHYRLHGLVRDFRADHPDFDVVPDGGYGQVSGYVNHALWSINGTPAFHGDGFRVESPWRDAAGEPLAPHLFNEYVPGFGCYTVPGIATDGLISLNNQAMVDSFDSRLGPYGPPNVSSDALVSTNLNESGGILVQNNTEIYGSVLGGPGADMTELVELQPSCEITGSSDTLERVVPMPMVEAPSDLGLSIGNVLYDSGTKVIAHDLHVGNLVVEENVEVRVMGDRTILCEGNLLLDRAEIIVEGSRTLFVKGDVTVQTSPMNMNTGDPSRLRLVKLGPGTLEFLGNNSDIVAMIIAPEATLNVRQGSQVFGTFIGESLVLDNQAKFHIDTAYSGPVNFEPDTPGSKGSTSRDSITSSSTFAEWFHDVLDVNQSTVHAIWMQRNSAGIYEYLDDQFYPIEDDLLGNDGEEHNHFFTYAIVATFEYDACTDQFFEIQGGDGSWVFINGDLVIDLGGISPATPQRVHLDRLGLLDGRTYELRLFHADRSDVNSVLRIRTNLVLKSVLRPTVNSMFD